MPFRLLDVVKSLLLSAMIALTFSQAFAQGQTSASKASGSSDEVLQQSRTQIYAGWAYLFPGTSVVNKIRDIPSGFLIDSTTFLKPKFGLQVETGTHRGSNANISTIQGGPVYRMPLNMITPFLHSDVGIMRMAPAGFNTRNGISLTLGGGMDVHLWKAIDWRLIQADYLYSHLSFVPAGPRINPESARLSTGLVLNLGNFGPSKPAELACSAVPMEVNAGSQVQITGTPANFDPKRKLTYMWNSSGGRVMGDGQNVTIDTTGLNAGNYTVNGHVTDGKKMVDCSTSFTVNVPPPTVACSANPTTVQLGGTATISSQSSSAANRPLTYSYNASAGQISGQGATATLNTAGAPPGPITVTCNVSDDKGQTARATTTVTVAQPPAPTVACSVDPNMVLPGNKATITSRGSSSSNRPLTYRYSASAGEIAGQGDMATYTAGADPGTATVTCTVADDLGQTASANAPITVQGPANSIAFHPYGRRPRPNSDTRVDNTAKAILDDIALQLKRSPDSRLAVVGEYDPMERNGQTKAAQRAVNAKAYLTAKKVGIDPKRIDVRSGPANGMKADLWVVPAGATFDPPGTQPVDETKVKAIPRMSPRSGGPVRVRKPAAQAAAK